MPFNIIILIQMAIFLFHHVCPSFSAIAYPKCCDANPTSCRLLSSSFIAFQHGLKPNTQMTKRTNITCNNANDPSSPFLHFLPSMSSASNPPPLPPTDNPYIILGLRDPYDSGRSDDQNSEQEAEQYGTEYPTIDEIKHAYHRLVHFYHPDSKRFHLNDSKDVSSLEVVAAGKRLEERERDFKKINEAYMKLISTQGKYNVSELNAKTHYQAPSENKQRQFLSLSTAITRLCERYSFPWSAWNKLKKGELLVLSCKDSKIKSQESKPNPPEILREILDVERNRTAEEGGIRRIIIEIIEHKTGKKLSSR